MLQLSLWLKTWPQTWDHFDISAEFFRSRRLEETKWMLSTSIQQLKNEYFPYNPFSHQKLLLINNLHFNWNNLRPPKIWMKKINLKLWLKKVSLKIIYVAIYWKYQKHQNNVWNQLKVCNKDNRKTSFRSSHQGCSIETGALKNFTKFSRKHLYQSPFLK